MQDGKLFVDSNILVYAYDVSAGSKHATAAELIRGLWMDGRGVISTQVLQEFFVNVTGKIAKPLRVATAKEIVKDFSKWKPVLVGTDVIVDAIDIHHENKYSFWDALIIAAAVEGGATTLLSEDLSDKQRIKGISIKNPFK
jgi:predicted nucleic acid-binding protein